MHVTMRLSARTAFFFVLALWIITTAGGSALAQRKRVALVIGNSDYTAAGKLKNPVNDANIIASALAASTFQTVHAAINLGIAEFRQALRRFQSEAEGAEVALIYYAGHGLEANGVNWLVPVDAELAKEGDLEYEAIRIDLALRALAGARMRLLILDACRNNPLARSWSTASRSIEQGLRPIEADDVLVLFAAAPGRIASDGAGSNSPFATAVAKWLPEPGLALQLLGGRVRDDVLQSTRGSQRPYVSASITGEPFYLIPATTSSAGNDDKANEDAFWHAIKDTKSAHLLRSYVERFPSGANVSSARALLAQIEKEAAAQEEVSRREAELRKAEDARQAAELMKRDAERKAAEARLAADLRKAQQEAKAARDALLAAEKEREAALKAAESARKVETETRKAGESLGAASPALAAEGQDVEILVRSIQRELQRVGCDPGKEDGKWGANVKEAMERLNRALRTSIATDAPATETLAVLSGKKGRVCPTQCGNHERVVGGRCVAKASAPKPAAEGAPVRTKPASSDKALGMSDDCRRWRQCTLTAAPVASGYCGAAPSGCSR